MGFPSFWRSWNFRGSTGFIYTQKCPCIQVLQRNIVNSVCVGSRQGVCVYVIYMNMCVCVCVCVCVCRAVHLRFVYFILYKLFHNFQKVKNQRKIHSDITKSFLRDCLNWELLMQTLSTCACMNACSVVSPSWQP